MKIISYFILILGLIGVTRNILRFFTLKRFYYSSPRDFEDFSNYRERATYSKSFEPLAYYNKELYEQWLRQNGEIVRSTADYLILIGGALLFLSFL